MIHEFDGRSILIFIDKIIYYVLTHIQLCSSNQSIQLGSSNRIIKYPTGFWVPAFIYLKVSVVQRHHSIPKGNVALDKMGAGFVTPNSQQQYLSTPS
jgi:hypothetical protein